mgnify:CR=1 FL=1
MEPLFRFVKRLTVEMKCVIMQLKYSCRGGRCAE